MNDNLMIERYGNLLKEEELVSMEEKILPGTFVLEAPEPFPGYFGYYNNEPVEAKPLYVYFVLKHLVTLEQVTRAYQNIRRFFSAKNMHAAAGVVTLFDEHYHVLRIRHLDSYDQIASLQSAFLQEGFEFAKKPGKKIDTTGLIRIKKFFILQEVAEGIFFDQTEKDHAYFVIPMMLEWEHFKHITQQVKYNWDRSVFDAAVAHIHNNFEIIDMIRIYNPDITVEYMKEVRNKYLSRIK